MYVFVHCFAPNISSSPQNIFSRKPIWPEAQLASALFVLKLRLLTIRLLLASKLLILHRALQASRDFRVLSIPGLMWNFVRTVLTERETAEAHVGPFARYGHNSFERQPKWGRRNRQSAKIVFKLRKDNGGGKRMYKRHLYCASSLFLLYVPIALSSRLHRTLTLQRHRAVSHFNCNGLFRFYHAPLRG